MILSIFLYITQILDSGELGVQFTAPGIFLYGGSRNSPYRCKRIVDVGRWELIMKSAKNSFVLSRDNEGQNINRQAFYITPWSLATGVKLAN
jgi:hypothetical protein